MRASKLKKKKARIRLERLPLFFFFEYTSSSDPSFDPSTSSRSDLERSGRIKTRRVQIHKASHLYTLPVRGRTVVRESFLPVRSALSLDPATNKHSFALHKSCSIFFHRNVCTHSVYVCCKGAWKTLCLRVFTRTAIP